jgi:hypothetical protein
VFSGSLIKEELQMKLVIGLTILISSAVLSGAHFMSYSAALQGANLHVEFREAGLGNNQTINFIARAHAVAVYGCINGGDKNPKASNKRAVEGDVSKPGSFSSGKNGSLRGSLDITPPDDATFTCPGGQIRVMGSISYSNVSITDTTNNVTQQIPGTYSATFRDF